MYHNIQNNYYGSYSYIPPLPRSTYLEENIHYQNYDSRLHIQQSLYSNTTPTVTRISSLFHQRHQPSTTISDLAEPLSVFDDIKFTKHHRSNVIPFPSVHMPSSTRLQRSVSDARFATASVMYKRLLNDIQHNISEIDQELSLLERRPSISRRIPSRTSSIAVMRQTSIDKKMHSSNENNQIRSNKPKRIYEVIPRITNESKTTSQQSTPKRTDQSSSHSYIGQYHYGPEIEEIEIRENDPENSNLQSTVDEIPKLSFHEILSLDQFRRHQPALPQNRAVIFIPDYRDHNKIEFNKTAEGSCQNNPTNKNITQSSTVKSSKDFASVNKLNIQTAPKPKTEISSPATRNPQGFSHKIKSDLINTILSKPVKYSGPSKLMITTIQEEIPSSEQTVLNPISSKKNSMDGNTSYFFSDVGNECDIVEAHIPVDTNDLTLPTGSEIIPDSINNGFDDEKELRNTSTFLFFV